VVVHRALDCIDAPFILADPGVQLLASESIEDR
jgi:hypothetical protein